MPTKPAPKGHLANGDWLNHNQRSPEILRKAANKKKAIDNTFKPVNLNWGKKNGQSNTD